MNILKNEIKLLQERARQCTTWPKEVPEAQAVEQPIRTNTTAHAQTVPGRSGKSAGSCVVAGRQLNQRLQLRLRPTGRR